MVLEQIQPLWPVIKQGPTVRLPTRTTRPAKIDGFATAVILPDMQIGFYRDMHGVLQPTHDEQALNVALAITRHINPDHVILLGDNLDLPELGKYRFSPAFGSTTQAAIDRATMLAAQVRDAAPFARCRWLEGNHEARLTNYMLDNAKDAFGLRRGAPTPELWPVLSVPYLCRFDQVGMEYVDGYPAGVLWLNDRLKCIHGTKAKSNGSTAHAYLNDTVSVLYGHIHRREWAERTRDTRNGPATIMAASPGCLAKTTGAVPSTRGAVDLDGRPLPVVEDWQQGVGVVRFETGGGNRFFYEQVPIIAGEALYHNRLFKGEP